MHKVRGTLLAGLMGIFAAGCASPPTPFQPASIHNAAPGYSHQWREDGTVRVRFRSNSPITSRTVDGYLLYRSAQLADGAGAPAFVIIEGGVDRSVLEGTARLGFATDAPDAPATAEAVVARTDGLLDLQSHPAPRMIRTAGPDLVRAVPARPLRPAAPPAIANGSKPLPVPAYAPTVLPRPEPTDRSVVIRLLAYIPPVESIDTFVVRDVLATLSNRIAIPIARDSERVERLLSRPDICQATSNGDDGSRKVCEFFGIRNLRAGARWADALLEQQASGVTVDLEAALASRMSEELQYCMRRNMQREQIQGPPRTIGSGVIAACKLDGWSFSNGAKAIFRDAATRPK